MSCIVEKHDDRMWYCCDCKDGPLSLKLCGMCCACGHERCKTFTVLPTPVDSEDDSSAKNRKGKKRGELSPYNSKTPLKRDISSTANLDLPVATKEFRFPSPIERSKRTDDALDAKIQLTRPISNTNPYSSPTASTTGWQTVSSPSPCSSVASSEDEDEDDDIEPRKAAQAQYSAKHLLENPNLKFNATSATFVDSTSGGESGVVSVPNVSMAGNSSTSSPQDRASKRSRGNRSRPSKDDEEGEDEDEDEDGDRKKRPRSVQSVPDYQEQPANFACPFPKHNYTKYSMTSCRNYSSNIPRLKEHLYKKHSLHPCQRCKVEFLTIPELKVHLQVEPGCEYKESVSENTGEGVTLEMKKKIKSRTGLKFLSKSKQWYDIYKIIFGTDCILSPFFQDIDNERSQRHHENPNRPVRDFAQRLLPMFEILMEQHLRGTGEVETGRLLESLDKPAIESAIQTALNQLLPPHQTLTLQLSSGSTSHEDMPTADPNIPATTLPANDCFTTFSDLYAESRRANPSQTLGTYASPSALRDSFTSSDTGSFNTIDQDTDFALTSIIPISQSFTYQDTYIAEHEHTKSTRLQTASAVSYSLDHGHNNAYLDTYFDPGELFPDDVVSRGYTYNVGTGDEGNDSILSGDMDEDWGLDPIT